MVALAEERTESATVQKLKQEMADNPEAATEAGDALLRSVSVAMDAASSSLDPSVQAMARDHERIAMDPAYAVSVGFRQQLLQAVANLQARAKAEEEVQAPKPQAEQPVVGAATAAESERRVAGAVRER